MALIPRVIKKKAKSVGPVFVEGKPLRRFGVDVQAFFIWLDKRIGTGVRNLVMPHWKVVDNQIMFLPYQHDVACNPKYISDELIRRQLPVEIYWSVNRAQFYSLDVEDVFAKLTGNGVVNTHDPEYQKLNAWVKEHVHFVRPNSYEYFRAAGTSKILVTNSILGDKFYGFPVKKDQYVVETWHGSLGIKRFDLDHYNTNMSWPHAALRTGRQTTHCISNSTFEDAVFRETFWQKTPILQLGHARNDIFFPNYAGMAAFLRRNFLEEYELAEDEHFALYAPTFRDDHNFNVFRLNPRTTVAALKKRFGGKWKLLVRYHDNDRKTGAARRSTIKGPEVIDVTSYPDMQELLAFTDVAITDYSSWIYDFVLTRKPGFIFAMDIAEYNNERGFYFRLEDTPFPVAVDSDELAANIEAFDEKKYQKDVTSFLSDKGCIDDGHASERIADQFADWCGVTAGKG